MKDFDFLPEKIVRVTLTCCYISYVLYRVLVTTLSSRTTPGQHACTVLAQRIGKPFKLTCSWKYQYQFHSKKFAPVIILSMQTWSFVLCVNHSSKTGRQIRDINGYSYTSSHNTHCVVYCLFSALLTIYNILKQKIHPCISQSLLEILRSWLPIPDVSQSCGQDKRVY